MSTLRNSSVIAAAMMLAHSAASLAAEEAASADPAPQVAPATPEIPATPDVPVAEDLTAVIALQGQSCGKVASAVQTGEDAYLATCQDGNRYRIFVNAEGRVVVAKVEKDPAPAGNSPGD